MPSTILPPEPSSWRLVNLALGLSSVVSFAGALGLFPDLVPSRWVMAPWLPSSMATVPIASTLLARIGINLWLPASILILLFVLVGLHRRTGAAGSKGATVALTLAWLTNIAMTFVPLMIVRGEAAGAVMFVIGMFLSPLYLAVMIAASVAAAIEFSAMKRSDASPLGRSQVALLSWAFVPPILSVVPLLLAPGNPLALSLRQSKDFEASCTDAGVQLMDKPTAPVRSIAYDWDPQRFKSRPFVDRIETDGGGRVLSYGGFALPRSRERAKKLELDFTESRRDLTRSGEALINPEAPYYHFPDRGSKQPYYGIDAFTADALLFMTADDVGAQGEASGQFRRYRLTLTDRRSGAALGVQTFVVDKKDGRACGVNVDSAISSEAFIYDAIHR